MAAPTGFFVQFPHPGGEQNPRTSDIPWNTGDHRRKFLVTPGRYLDDPSATPSSSTGASGSLRPGWSAAGLRLAGSPGHCTGPGGPNPPPAGLGRTPTPGCGATA